MTDLHKLNLRLPFDLAEQAKAEAVALHVSLNTYILQAIDNYVPYTRAGRSKRAARQAAQPASPESRAQRAPGGHGALATGAPGREVPK